MLDIWFYLILGSPLIKFPITSLSSFFKISFEKAPSSPIAFRDPRSTVNNSSSISFSASSKLLIFVAFYSSNLPIEIEPWIIWLIPLPIYRTSPSVPESLLVSGLAISISKFAIRPWVAEIKAGFLDSWSPTEGVEAKLKREVLNVLFSKTRSLWRRFSLILVRPIERRKSLIPMIYNW